MGMIVIYGGWIIMIVGFLWLFITGQVNIFHMLILLVAIYMLSSAIDSRVESTALNFREQYKQMKGK